MAYRETIKKRVEKVEGKFIRQSGGKGQYGHCVINMQPSEPGQGFVFEDKIVGGVDSPREFIGPIEQGIKEALVNGVLAGYPMVDVKVELVYGSYHDVDSSEMAFKIAGSMAIKEAAKKAHPVILEPMMNVEVVCPDAYMGDVLGDLSARRGKIGGMTQRGEAQVIDSTVPLSEMFGYSDQAALDVAGARGVLDGVRALRGSTEEQGRRDHRQGHAEARPNVRQEATHDRLFQNFQTRSESWERQSSSARSRM